MLEDLEGKCGTCKFGKNSSRQTVAERQAYKGGVILRCTKSVVEFNSQKNMYFGKIVRPTESCNYHQPRD